MTDLVDDEKERVKGVLRSTCRGGEEEEGIVRVRGRRSAWVPDGVGRHVRAHSCGLRACESYGRAVVEEVRGATEGERIVSGLFPEEFEEVDRLAMGEDVQQAQKLSVDATRGGHDGWEESQKSIGCRVCLAVLPHFAVGSVVEQRIGVSVAQLSVAVHVPPAVTRVVTACTSATSMIRSALPARLMFRICKSPFCPPRLEVTCLRRVVKPARLTTFSKADKMCSCASLVDPLCWEHVWEWSPSASRTKRPQLQRRCGPFKAGIAMPRNWQNHDVHRQREKS